MAVPGPSAESPPPAARRGVLIIGTYPPPFGGVPRHIEYLVPSLAARGWDVHVLSSGRSGAVRGPGYTVHRPGVAAKLLALGRHGLPGREVRRSGIDSIRRESPRTWLNYMTALAVGRRIVERGRIEVISAYNLVYGGPVGAILSREYGIPLVVNNLGEIYSDPGFFARHERLVEYVCAAGSRFVSCSRHCADSYRALGRDPGVEVIPFGIDVGEFAGGERGEGLRAELGLGRADRLVVYVGRMVRDMGLHTVLEAVPRLLASDPTLRFLLAGNPGELTPDAHALAAAHPGAVFVMPGVPLERLPEVYAAATLFLAPTLSRRACSSLAAAEAMASGKPVVASGVGGIPELVVDGATGLVVPPDDPGALAAAVLELVADPARMRELGAAGRERARGDWDQATTNARIDALLRSLLRA